MLKLSIIFDDKVSLDETSAFIENIVPGLNVKLITFLKRVFRLNLLFNYKGHVTEGEREELIQDNPVVILAVHTVTLVLLKETSVKFLHTIFVVIGCDGASPIHEEYLLGSYNIGRPLVVPDD